MDERRQRTAAAVAAVGADFAVLTSPDAVAYATGHVVPIEAGPSPFAGGPTTAIIGKDGSAAVIAANVEGGSAAASFADFTETYEGFGWQQGPDLHVNYAAAVKRAMSRLGVKGTLAIEPTSFTSATRDILGNVATVSITDALNRTRAIKTAAELKAMERAGSVAAAGQKSLAAAVKAGGTELDVFARVRAAMENAAGQRVAVTGDFLTGVARTAGFTGWPINRPVVAGDPIMSDLAPRVDGYWGDSCFSAVWGTPSEGYLKLFNAAKSALDLAGSIMKPGLRIDELDARLRAEVGKAGYNYPHHSGHSLGTAVHEWPRLVPYESAVLEKDMIVMVEPGAYDPAIGGVRLEWMFYITATGCRNLTEFTHTPQIT